MTTTDTVSVTVSAPANAIGSPAGERFLREAMTAISEITSDEAGIVVVLDLKRVTLATTSFVKAALLPLFFAGQRHADRIDSGLGDLPGTPSVNVYPVFANMEPDVEDTVQEVFAGRRLPFLVAPLDSDSLGRGRIAGFLDEALSRTMRLIGTRDYATALELADEFPAEGVKPTAWNNRLNDLWRLRLLRRVKRGKSWWYLPVLKELTYGR